MSTFAKSFQDNARAGAVRSQHESPTSNSPDVADLNPRTTIVATVQLPIRRSQATKLRP